MSLWERIVHLFHHHPRPDCSAQVDAAFRDAAASQVRTKTAASGVVDAASAHRARINAVRGVIRERAAEHEARRHAGQTSHIASVVEDALRGSRAFGGSEDA